MRIFFELWLQIAHQWFGNLVTMQWWTHLWLNEGYATFMQFLCVDHMYPDFKIWTQFVVKEFDSVLGLDSLVRIISLIQTGESFLNFVSVNPIWIVVTIFRLI